MRFYGGVMRSEQSIEKRKAYSRNRAKIKREAVNATSRRYRQRNPAKVKQFKLMHRYGITMNDYNELLAIQSGVCAICGSVEKLQVDHCHKRNVVRGILCSHCNSGLGHFRDNPEVLERAAKYLLYGLGHVCA